MNGDHLEHLVPKLNMKIISLQYENKVANEKEKGKVLEKVIVL